MALSCSWSRVTKLTQPVSGWQIDDRSHTARHSTDRPWLFGFLAFSSHREMQGIFMGNIDLSPMTQLSACVSTEPLEPLEGEPGCSPDKPCC
jgi:hypothetical protein